MKKNFSSQITTQSEDIKPKTTEVGQRNFWTPGSFSVATKRTENSTKVPSDLLCMFDDMATIESKMGKLFVEFSEKWKKHFESLSRTNDFGSVLYGSFKDTILKMILLFEDKGKSHMEIWKQIQSKCYVGLKEFNEQQNNKNFGLSKTVKEIKDDFQTSQQSYVEVYSNFRKARLNYMNYCFSINPNYNPTENPEAFNDVGPKKNEKRVKLQKRYQERKEQLSLVIPHYEKKMRETYDKCEVVERAKLEAINKSLNGLVYIYSLEQNERLNQFKGSLKEAYNSLDVEHDLQSWRSTFGPDAEYDFFQTFESKVKRPVSTAMSIFKDEEPTNTSKNNSKAPCLDDESSKE